MTLKKVLVMIFLMGLLVLGNSLEGASVNYRVNVSGIGWQPWMSDGQTAGTVGQNRQMEAVQITLNFQLLRMGLKYRVHVTGIGWQSWKVIGQIAGTTGQSKGMEAIQITLANPPLGYALQYRAHVAEKGWLDWVTDGQTAGTTGENRRMEAIEIKLAPATTCRVPPYAPAFWNDGCTIQHLNNCYNYANNKRTDTYAQPGRAGGSMYITINCLNVVKAALADGLEPTTASAIPPQGKTKIALVVASNLDYHWYRQDNNGNWSHKPGGTKVTNLDNSKKVITNPETANRGYYTLFCGYFLTCAYTNQGIGLANIK